MTKTITLRQIEVFRALIDMHTVSATAELLGISQPAVSKTIAQLETDAELRLFDRARNRLIPNRHGMRLYEEIQKVFAGVGQIERALDLIRRERHHLYIGVLPALGDRFIHAVSRSFLDRNEDVFLSIMCRDSPTIMSLVSTGELDVGIVSGEFASAAPRAEPLLKSPLMCALPRRHPLARRKSVRPRDLDGQPFIAFSQQAMRKSVDHYFAKHSIEPFVVLEATTAPTICEFVASGLGITILHPLMAVSASSRLTLRPLDDAPLGEFAVLRSTIASKADMTAEFAASAHKAAKALVGYFGSARKAD
jgi:DNA-binding transcriptional LysR family regulator